MQAFENFPLRLQYFSTLKGQGPPTPIINQEDGTQAIQWRRFLNWGSFSQMTLASVK